MGKWMFTAALCGGSTAMLFGCSSHEASPKIAPSPQISPQTTIWQARHYYETKIKVTGKQALQACSNGFHMANMAEIINPSALKYDLDLGFTLADSGSGPPFGEEGWVRTGGPSWGPGPTSGGGIANCSVWTSEASDESGTVVSLTPGWGPNTGSIYSGPMQNNIFTPSIIAPWKTRPVGRTGSTENIPPSLCSESYRVWCVQD
jgi:hypothetical protein